MRSHFIWADLSTFDISAAKCFYNKIFGWKYQATDEGYELCLVNQGATAGLYTMPEKFQNINMPSFWMSYIHVRDIEKTVIDAEKHGAKVEIRPQPGPGTSRIALIRDPSGAGFTCYEGESPNGRDSTGGLAHIVWNELHVSDITKVKSFYEKVFGWYIKPTHIVDRYEIFTSPDQSKPIAGIQVTSNEVKGDKEYWGVYFSVSNLDEATASIRLAGGEIVAEQPLGEHLSLLAYDSQGAAFYVVENSIQSNATNDQTGMSQLKWRAIAGLLLVVAAVLLEANWIWGALFLLWVIPDIKYGVTHFMERIDRRQNSVTFWLVIATWVCLSIYLLVEPLI
jgi:predicted enzyme related to lactoylglutathione lyase